MGKGKSLPNIIIMAQPITPINSISLFMHLAINAVTFAIGLVKKIIKKNE